MNRKQKIETIHELLKGVLITPPDRDAVAFKRVGENQYQQVGTKNIVSLSDIEQINEPYKRMNKDLPLWKETRKYEDKEVVYFGLPHVIQINTTSCGNIEPDEIVLPAFRALGAS